MYLHLIDLLKQGLELFHLCVHNGDLLGGAAHVLVHPGELLLELLHTEHHLLNAIIQLPFLQKRERRYCKSRNVSVHYI